MGGGVLYAQDVTRLKVGLQPDGRIVVPTNQVLAPAGRQFTFLAGRSISRCCRMVGDDGRQEHAGPGVSLMSEPAR